MKTITKFFIAAVALFGVATAATAKNLDNTKNDVSSDTEQVAEHEMNVYGPNFTVVVRLIELPIVLLMLAPISWSASLSIELEMLIPS